uniref:F-box domain-containing protein n=1 Tax=Romanomermis culicivorax TaxID=13658 RepID=A0A915J2P1_ROMCU
MADYSISVPDFAWLSIIRHLDVQSIVKLSCTCSALNRLCNDKNVWRDVDFTSLPKFDSRVLANFLFSTSLPIENVESIIWHGRHLLGARKKFVQAPIIRLIGEKCPKLKCLKIVYCDVTEACVRDFPNTLKSLSLEGSLLRPDFFRTFLFDDFMPHLRILNLNKSHNLGSKVTEDTMLGLKSRASKFTVLRLGYCYVLPPDFLHSLVSKLNNIRILSLNNLSGVNAAFCLLLRENCPRLTDLDLSFCKEVDDLSIAHLCATKCGSFSDQSRSSSIVDHLPLKRLSLVEIGRLSDKIFDYLLNLPELIFVDVIKTHLSCNAMEAFQKKRPACKIYSKFSENAENVGAGFMYIDVGD